MKETAQLSVKEQLKNVALADVVSSRRVADTLREAFVGALLAKVKDMSPSEILDSMDRIDKMPIKSYQDVLDMIETA